MKKYRLVIFDWDGTLADSTGRIVYAMQSAAAKQGQAYRSDWEVKQIIGLGLGEAITELWPDISGSALVDMKQAYAQHYQDEVAPQVVLFPGARELLERLTHAGVMLAVATGKSRRGLNAVLDEMSLEHIFKITRCADETASKPDPMMLNEILAETQMSQDAVLMVGDTSFDLDMAFHAGVDAVALTHGAHDNARLSKSMQIAAFPDLNEFQKWMVERI